MYTTLVFYCILVALASAFGGALPGLVRFTHRRIQMTLSLVSGVMLGVALLHLLPHAIDLVPKQVALSGCLGGLLLMFFLIRMFHFHQHDLGLDEEPSAATAEKASVEAVAKSATGSKAPLAIGGSEGELVQLTATPHALPRPQLCDGSHHHVHCQSHSGKLDFSWAGLCFGLAIHTILDGIALAAACQAEHPQTNVLAGLGTFLAIVLHKPLDALSITSLMAARGWPLSQQFLVNLVFATMCPLGALTFAFSIDHWLAWRDVALGLALAVSAGVFLCISLGDLLPELHFHSHDRFRLSLMLLLGVAIAVAIELLPGHQH
jgi:zinc and cadmium transporter